MKNNADPAMRNRPLIGVRVLLGLKPDGQTNGPAGSTTPKAAGWFSKLSRFTDSDRWSWRVACLGG